MRNNPDTDRRRAAEQLVEAAGSKLISLYGTGVLKRNPVFSKRTSN